MWAWVFQRHYSIWGLPSKVREDPGAEDRSHQLLGVDVSDSAPRSTGWGMWKAEQREDKAAFTPDWGRELRHSPVYRVWSKSALGVCHFPFTCQRSYSPSHPTAPSFVAPGAEWGSLRVLCGRAVTSHATGWGMPAPPGSAKEPDVRRRLGSSPRN